MERVGRDGAAAGSGEAIDPAIRSGQGGWSSRLFGTWTRACQRTLAACCRTGSGCVVGDRREEETRPPNTRGGQRSDAFGRIDVMINKRESPASSRSPTTPERATA